MVRGGIAGKGGKEPAPGCGPPTFARKALSKQVSLLAGYSGYSYCYSFLVTVLSPKLNTVLTYTIAIQKLILMDAIACKQAHI